VESRFAKSGGHEDNNADRGEDAKEGTGAPKGKSG